MRAGGVLHTLRRIVRYFRWIILILLCLGSWILVQWSQNFDPRFFFFLETPPGRVLSRVMNWPTIHNLPPTDRSIEDLSEDERLLKRKLERELSGTWPTHQIFLKNGGTLTGRVESRDAAGIWFSESFGRDGKARMRIPFSNVVSLRPYREPKPNVTWRDLKFQQAYPDFQLILRENYTVLSDAGYYQVADSIQELENLHREFVNVFGDLIRFKGRGHGIQVLFFSDEEGYRRHQNEFAPSLIESAGFYAPLKDRMVVFNQFHSTRSTAVRSRVDRQIQDMLSQADSGQERRRILGLKDRTDSQLRRQAQTETYATLRHEGTHHLTFTYGVLSSFHAENAWLVEGLAVYCEPEAFGDVPVAHLSTLIGMMEGDRWMGLKKLVDRRDPHMLQAFEPEYHAYEAYAAAWSLIHFLMEPLNRPGFFSYIEYIRDPENLDDVVSTSRSDLLAGFLQTTPEALELAWIDHVSRL